MRIISPSLLSADFKNIKKDIQLVENSGAKRLHLDVMDGHFVSNLTFGPMLIKAIRECTQCHLETHLMIEHPIDSIDQYIEAGSDTIIFHLEASAKPDIILSHIKERNVLAGIALSPDTDEQLLYPFLDLLDYILIMSVYPGKGGQTFITKSLKKMENIVSMRTDRNILIGVDGGVNRDTISSIYDTGIDVTIVGSGLFNSNNVSERFQELLNA